MIGWQQPGALAWLALAAVPLIIHLLRTRRADRRQFPSIRFIRPSNTAAVRLRSPSDWLLLVVRTAIIAASVLALARPVWLTSARLARWNGLTSRAILVDTSESMRRPGPSGRRAADAAEEAAAVEKQSASHAARIDSDNLTRELRRAAAWLRDVPPSRREIVIISDVQRGALDANALTGIPSDIGVRFVDAGSDVHERVVDVFGRFGVTRTPPRSQQVTLTDDSTRVTLKEDESTDGRGLQILTSSAEAPDAEKLLRAVAMAGAPAPSPAQRLIFEFPGSGRNSGTNQAIAEEWMLRTVIRLQQDEDLQRAARRKGTTSSAATTNADRERTVVARDKEGIPIVTATASGSEMLIAVGAPVSSFLAAATVRSTLAARQGPVAIPEAEVLRIPRATLSAQSRPPGPVEQDAWRRAGNSDARWLWLTALALLVVEQWLRSPRHAASEQKVTRAAAA